ncbi:MAG: hypothetical protein DMD58_06475 [Gemmatimonadetes bacterium]|nr:MAG: hypothetical protein DMD58_06475 [Gemmatimonadota bacterium]
MRRISCALLAVSAISGCSHDRSVSFDPRVSRGTLTELSEARYTVAYLPTLGGSRNRAAGVSNSGLIAGFVNRPGNATRVAAFWHGTVLDTLGTLGGPNSIVQWPGVSNNGIVAGISETAALDTLHEEWSCTAFLPSVTGHICVGSVWQNGVMKPKAPVPRRHVGHEARHDARAAAAGR